MWTIIAGAVGTSLMLSLIGTWLVRRWSLRMGFVDRPGGHKQHGREVALGGGIAIVAAAVLPLLVGTWAAALLAPYIDQHGQPLRDGLDWVPLLVRQNIHGIAERTPMLLAIVGGALVLHILGIIDDRKALPAGPKFLIQFLVAAFIVIVCKIRALELLPAPLSAAATILWIVVITNAFNFLDNMDGLSAGVGAISAAIFASASMMAGQIFVPVMAWVWVGALLGYLVFNFYPARVYMGDAGSLPIGFSLGVLTVLITFFDPERNMQPYGVMTPLAVLAVPLYDVISVCIIRLRAGDSPFRGDRRHFSHRLVARGMTVRTAVLTIYLATVTTGMSALLLSRADWSTAILAIAQCICVVAIIALLEHAAVNRTPDEPAAPSP